MFDTRDEADPEPSGWFWSDDDVAPNEDVEFAMLPPADRFEREYGLPTVPEVHTVTAVTSAGAAAAMQDIAVQLERVRRFAEAHRIAGLLEAHAMSLADLRLRFPRDIGLRGGLGEQAFFKSMGLLTQTHPFTVAREVNAALTIRDRLPKTWAVFQSGAASWSRVQTAAKEAEGLDAQHWPAYDDVAAVEVVTSTRLKDVLRKTRERLQDHTAAARARTTHERRHIILELGADGAAALIINGSAPEWVGFNQALHRAAVAAHGVEGETRTLAQLKHDICRDLLLEGIQQRADPASTGLQVPQRIGVAVQLVLTVPALAWLGKTKEQAQLSGFGPIDLETAKGLAGKAKSFIRVLTDPFTGVRMAMDRKTYAPPADLARWVRIRDGRSRFPGSMRPSFLADIDHAREWQHGGTTDAVNLITLDRSSHNLKSNGLYADELDPDGSVTLIDPWGRRFIDPPFDPMDPVPTDLLPPSPDPDEPCPF